MEVNNTQYLPLVSVGIPVYNEQKYIRKLIQSIISQTYTHLEIIISDNASNDKTWSIIQEFSDQRIVSFRQSENFYAVKNFEFVLDQANGVFFIWAGGHDLWDKNMIEKCLQAYVKHQNSVLIVPKVVNLDINGNIVNSDKSYINTTLEKSQIKRAFAMYRNMNRCNAIYGLFHRETLLKTMPFPDTIDTDFIVLMKVASLGNVVSCRDSFWVRRNQRVIETTEEKLHRYKKDLRLSPFSRKYPYLACRIALFRELYKFNGNLLDKFFILLYFFQKRVLRKNIIKLLLSEVSNYSNL